MMTDRLAFLNRIASSECPAGANAAAWPAYRAACAAEAAKIEAGLVDVNAGIASEESRMGSRMRAAGLR